MASLLFHGRVTGVGEKKKYACNSREARHILNDTYENRAFIRARGECAVLRKRFSWLVVGSYHTPCLRLCTPVVALFPPRNDNLRHAAACLSAFFPATSTRCSSQADENRSIVTRAIEIAVIEVEHVIRRSIPACQNTGSTFTIFLLTSKDICCCIRSVNQILQAILKVCMFKIMELLLWE